MMLKSHALHTTLLLSFTLLGGCIKHDDPSLSPSSKLVDMPTQATPEQVAFNKNRQAFFGDLHIHTGLSTDAYVLGVRSEPNDVYDFAKGKVIEHGAGYPIQISRPLDFAAVTDHAEYLGQARQAKLDLPLYRQSLSDLLKNESLWTITKSWFESSNHIRENGFSPGGQAIDSAINADAWQLTIDAAEHHYQPGLFTTFIGYE